jgi:hypothetical protein
MLSEQCYFCVDNLNSVLNVAHHSLVSPTVPSFDNRYYTVLAGANGFASAVSQASSLAFKGFKGYLATIDSYAEYAFILFQLRARQVWISANDTQTEGVWMTGPTPSSGGGVASVLPWGPGEPDGGRGEGCALLVVSSIADYLCTHTEIRVYVVEYECVSPNVIVNGTCLSKLDFT